MLQSASVLKVGQRHYVPENGILGDVASVVVPWAKLDRTAIRNGQLPLWNPHNGGGEPLLANFQSAFFSPFNVPFYLLPWRLGLVVSALAKLLSAGLGTYIFLRQLRRSRLAATTAAIAFMGSGYQILWLQWPLASPSALIPWVLVGVEAAASARRRAALVLACVGVSFAFACVLLAGHPETALFSLLVAGGYAVVRLVQLWGRSIRELATRAAALAGAGVLALGIAAVQLLPFVEYLSQSTAADFRQGKKTIFLNPSLAGLHLLPRLVGSPFDSYHGNLLDQNKIPLPYNLIASPYVGALVLGLAAVGVLSLRRRDRQAQYFAALAAAWLLYAYDVVGVGDVISKLPGLSVAHPNRSQVIWLFAVTVLASFGLDRLVAARRPNPDRARLAAFAAILVGLGALAVLLGVELIAQDVGRAGKLATDVARNEVVWIGATSALGIAATVVIKRLAPGTLRRVAAVTLPLVVFAQGGLHLRDFNSAIDPRYFYPRTEVLKRLAATTHGQTVLGADASGIPPEANTWYSISTPQQYDALGVRGYQQLARRLLRFPTYVIGGEEIGGLFGPPFPVNITALRTLGVRFVTSVTDYPWATPVSSTNPPGAVPIWNRAAPGTSAEWRMNGPASGSQVMTVRTRGASGTCSLEMRAAGDISEVLTASAPCGDGLTAFAVPVPAGAARSWSFQIKGPPGLEIGADRAGTPQTTLYASPVVGLQALWTQSGIRLFAVPASPSRYYTPARVEAVSVAAAKQRITSPSFDPSTTVIITGDEYRVPSADGAVGTVRVLSRSPDAVRLYVSRPDAGVLVALQSKFPGWVARVNGKKSPILEANLAFQAIPVPAGPSTVELTYEPESVHVGEYVSLGALVLALIGGAAALSLLMYRRADRRRRGGAVRTEQTQLH